MDSSKEPTRASRWLLLALCGVFGFSFLAGGIAAGALPLGHTITLAFASRSWQPVPARVVEADLEYGRKGTFAVHAVYRYEFRGQRYEAARIGTGRADSDDIGNWQSDWFRRLESARRSGRPVMAWVDPLRPQRALLDRSVRWELVAFEGFFALVFTGIGVTALWGFSYLLATPLHVLRRQHGTPEFARADRLVRTGALWLLAVCWCTLGFPLAALAWLEPAPMLPRALVSLFAAGGVALLATAWRRSLRGAVESQVRLPP